MADVEPASADRVLGRYTLRELLGAGGMGEVWAAHDPGLDRVVAVKLVRADLASPRTRSRLAREAQVLARINHPNVVAVYEVATEGDLVYFVQELVRGVDLQRWLGAAQRTWREIVDVFVQAGRGLASAHDASVVHRDFKPSNVLVGDDGRVRVGDFGLARTHRDDPEDVAATGSPNPTSATVTETGAVVGTPRYMSPEQHLGHAPTAAGDQFSFCVSLYQGLYRRLPFDETNQLDYSLAAVRGEVRKPSIEAAPPWLRELVLRGLRAGGRAPYPSMHALVDELAADHETERRQRWMIAGAALAVALFGGAVVVVANRRAEEPCSGADAQLATVWNDRVKTVAQGAFAATHLPYAPGAWSRVEAALDGYGTAWAAMRTETCKATRSGEQSEAVLDLRMSCLAHRLQELDAAAALLGRADADTVEKAQTIAASLPPLAGCADVDALRAVTPPPRDPAVAATVDALRARLATVRTLEHAGKDKEVLPLATALVADARTTKYPPVLADALLALASPQAALREDAALGPTLREAYVTAQASGLDHDAARAAGLYAQLLGRDKARRDDALLWLDVARGAVQRRPDRSLQMWVASKAASVLDDAARYADAQAELERAIALAPGDAADQLHMLAVVLEQQGKYGDALAIAREALGQEQRALGADHPTIAKERMEIASLLDRLGRYDEAVVEGRAALAAEERALGTDHPAAVSMRFNVASLLESKGQYADALAEYRHVLAIDVRRLPAGDPEIARLHERTGLMLGHLARFDEAFAELQTALALEAKHRDPDDPAVAGVHQNLGIVYAQANRLDDALRELHAALDIYERKLPDHPEIAAILSNIANLLSAQGKFDAALDAAHRALALQEKIFGADHPQVGSTHAVIGAVLADSGQHARALVELQQAVALLERAEGVDAPDVLGIHLNIGMSLAALGRHREAVTELSTTLAGMEKALGPHHPDVANARAALGVSLLALHEDDRAAEQLARAVDDLAKGQDPAATAAARAQLAQARWGKDPEAARALMVRARDELAKAGGPDAAPQLAEIKQWLAHH